MQLDEHDRDKLAAEDIRMQSKDESRVVENTNEPNATAKDDKQDSPKFQSVLQPGKLEAIPEGRMRTESMRSPVATMRCPS